MKPYLWRNETLPFVNSDFVNRQITDKYTYNYLSVNVLRKTSKNGVFSTERPFRDQYPLFFGLKIRIFLDKISKLKIMHNKLPIPSNEEDSVKHQKLLTASMNLQKTAIFPVKLPFSL